MGLEFHSLEKLASDLPRFLARHAQHATRSDRNNVQRRQMSKQVESLKHHPNPLPLAGRLRARVCNESPPSQLACHVGSIDEHLAFRRILDAIDAAEHCYLPAPLGPTTITISPRITSMFTRSSTGTPA